MIGPASLLHCRHWVFSDFDQCFFFGDVSFSHNLIVKFQPKPGTKRVAAVLTTEVMCFFYLFLSSLFSFCLSPDFQAGLGNFEGLRCSCRDRGKEVIIHLFILHWWRNSTFDNIPQTLHLYQIKTSLNISLTTAFDKGCLAVFFKYWNSFDNEHPPPPFLLNIWLKMLGLYEGIC